MKGKPKQDKGNPDDFYNLPRVTLFSKRQWDYLQRRYQMSPRELQIAQLACQGFVSKEIAEKLKIKSGTVKAYLRNIFSKIRVRSKILMLLRFIEDVNHLKQEKKE